MRLRVVVDHKRDRRQLLDRCLVFEALDEPGRNALADHATSASYAAAEPIFHMGDAGGSLMIVTRGTVRITLPTRSGREVILADLGAGEIFGEVAVLDGAPRSASATALTRCELALLDRAHVVAMLQRRPDVALAVIAILCGRLRRADERMAEIGLSQLPAKLAKLLLARALPATDSIPPRFHASQQELADMVGATRESVNRCLRDWHERGIVALEPGRISMSRLDALAALAERP